MIKIINYIVLFLVDPDSKAVEYNHQVRHTAR